MSANLQICFSALQTEKQICRFCNVSKFANLHFCIEKQNCIFHFLGKFANSQICIPAVICNGHIEPLSSSLQILKYAILVYQKSRIAFGHFDPLTLLVMPLPTAGHPPPLIPQGASHLLVMLILATSRPPPLIPQGLRRPAPHPTAVAVVCFS